MYQTITHNTGSDKATIDRIGNLGKSKVAAMANRKEEAKIIKKQQKVAKKQHKAYSNLSADTSHQAGGPSYAQGIPDIKKIESQQSKEAAAPPPNPMMAGKKGPGSGPPPNPVAAAGGGPGGPPPNPMMNRGGPPPNPVSSGAARPPPNPMMSGGPGGPPPAPVVKKRLTGAEMAALSRQNAEKQGAYNASRSSQSAAKQPPMVPVASSALLAGIRDGMNLRKTTQVKREPKMDQRDTLLAALRKKGQSGLKKVKEEDKNVKSEEKVDNTIFAILNRRQFMADDSDSDSASTWTDDSD